MDYKKPSIPMPAPTNTLIVIQSIKENIETITGQRGGEQALLQTSAALSDVISAVNTLIQRLNASGE